MLLLLDQAPDDTESVVKGAVRLVQNERVGTAHKDGNGLAGVLDTRDLDDAGSGGGDLLDEVGGSKLVLGKGVDIGDWLAASALLLWYVSAPPRGREEVAHLADELHLIAFNVLDDQDVELG